MEDFHVLFVYLLKAVTRLEWTFENIGVALKESCTVFIKVQLFVKKFDQNPVLKV
ncbi:hypothetical protein [Tepidibacter aestuarii]|uniref:hypothetical protein n=1 Tax=Tepidibacter aestuarii TaxID=2925782 RepID=UPI0020BE195D|nr:hypothetical protein [Tepidibacter aestuarii]